MKLIKGLFLGMCLIGINSWTGFKTPFSIPTNFFGTWYNFCEEQEKLFTLKNVLDQYQAKSRYIRECKDEVKFRQVLARDEIKRKKAAIKKIKNCGKAIDCEACEDNRYSAKQADEWIETHVPRISNLRMRIKEYAGERRGYFKQLYFWNVFNASKKVTKSNYFNHSFNGF